MFRDLDNAQCIPKLLLNYVNELEISRNAMHTAHFVGILDTLRVPNSLLCDYFLKLVN